MKTIVVASAAHESDETENLASSITTVLPRDIIYTHILTRFDGATLAAASSVSSALRQLCDDEDLWRNVCTTTWPSLLDPIASHEISTFPGGHRSFFSDAFPSLCHDNHHRYRGPLELISAVDIYCQGKPLFSTVQRMETQGNVFDFFLHLPSPVEVLQPNVSVPDSVKYLQENLRLSWIVIDTTLKHAANLSSWKPVSLQWGKNSDLEVLFAVVMAARPQGSSVEVQCVVKVTCCSELLQVKKVKMEIENMDGWPVTRREGVMTLQSAIENGERKKFDEVRAKERVASFFMKMHLRREMKIKWQPEMGDLIKYMQNNPFDKII